MKRVWLAASLAVSLASCSTLDLTSLYEDHSWNKPDEKIDPKELPSHGLNTLVKGVAYKLMSSNEFATPRTPVAVTSFVDLTDFQNTNWLGNQLTESFMHELHLHGLTVVDFKTTGTIRVTETGDFSMSRDWEELQDRHVIDYVVAGTMTPQGEGILLNVRMVGMQSRVVVASAQAYIPAHLFGGHVDELKRIDTKDGMIIRDDQTTDPNRVISIKK